MSFLDKIVILANVIFIIYSSYFLYSLYNYKKEERVCELFQKKENTFDLFSNEQLLFQLFSTTLLLIIVIVFTKIIKK